MIYCKDGDNFKIINFTVYPLARLVSFSSLEMVRTALHTHKCLQVSSAVATEVLPYTLVAGRYLYCMDSTLNSCWLSREPYTRRNNTFSEK